MTLFKFKGEATAAMMKTPSDRTAAVRELMESAGAELEGYYWILGPWDGMVIGSAPDSKTLAAVMVAVAGSNAMTHLETHELFTGDEVGDILGRAQDITYRPPGS
jgi:uncharacterized protein with GYD domain